MKTALYSLGSLFLLFFLNTSLYAQTQIGNTITGGGVYEGLENENENLRTTLDKIYTMLEHSEIKKSKVLTNHIQ